MQAQQFALRITGELKAGSNRDEAVAQLARLFSLSPDKAFSLLVHGSHIIRAGLDGVLAERYQAVLAHIGVKSVVEWMREEDHVVIQAGTEVRCCGERELPWHHIEKSDGLASLKVVIPGHDCLRVNASALICMDMSASRAVMQRETLSALETRLVSAGSGGCELSISAADDRDIAHANLHHESLYLRSEALLAASADVRLDVSDRHAAEHGSAQGHGLLQVTGAGPIWMSGDGRVTEVRVDGQYLAESSRVIAYSCHLQVAPLTLKGFWARRAWYGWHFSGKGRVWLQQTVADMSEVTNLPPCHDTGSILNKLIAWGGARH